MSDSSDARTQAADIPTAEQDQYLCEWLDLCTILRCSVPARAFLARRGQKFFRKFAVALQAKDVLIDILCQEYADTGASAGDAAGLKDLLDEDADDPLETVVSASPAPAPFLLRERPWMLLESYMCVPGVTGRKPYKDFLMAVAESNPDNLPQRVASIMAYIKRCFRTVVRTWVCQEGHDIRNSDGLIVRRTISETSGRELDGEEATESIFNRISRSADAVGRGEGQEALEVQDFLPAALPDPAEAANRSLLQTMADEIAKALIPNVTDAMRVALAARAYDVSLAHPAIEKFSGRRHTQLSFYLQTPAAGQASSSQTNLPSLINARMDACFPDLEADALPLLRGSVLGVLLEDTKAWLSRPENAELFRFLQAQEQSAL